MTVGGEDMEEAGEGGRRKETRGFCCMFFHCGIEFTDETFVFGDGTKVTVLEPGRSIRPPTVTVLPPSVKECEDRKDGGRRKKKTLVCLASGFYPDHVSVSWLLDGEEITRGVATDSAAVRRGEYYSVSSSLRVPLNQWFTPDANFTCVVSFFDGNQTVFRSSWVRGVEGPGAETIRAEYLRISRNVELCYIVLIFKSSLYGAFVVFLFCRYQFGLHLENGGLER